MSKELIHRYYDAFNKGDMKTFFSLLGDDVCHDINQGERQKGKAQFQAFMEGMNAFYKETVTNLVVFEGEKAGRFAAEFTIEGTYLKSAPGLPPAKNQKYTLPVGAFFEIKSGKVARITNYYNLQDWLDQVK